MIISTKQKNSKRKKDKQSINRIELLAQGDDLASRALLFCVVCVWVPFQMNV
jgi:hypothetical protein